MSFLAKQHVQIHTFLEPSFIIYETSEIKKEVNKSYLNVGGGCVFCNLALY